MLTRELKVRCKYAIRRKVKSRHHANYTVCTCDLHLEVMTDVRGCTKKVCEERWKDREINGRTLISIGRPHS